MTDRELDALVAEKVMGKTVEFIPSEPVEIKDDPTAFFGVTTNFGGAVFTSDREWLVDDWLDIEAVRAVANYSTDIAAAWAVVEKIAEGGFWLKLTTPFTPEQPYWAGFTPHNITGWNGRPDHQAGDLSPSRAICLAALKAVGVEVKDV